MPTKTAFIFAGIDALDLGFQRRAVLELPFVQHYLDRAQAVLRQSGSAFSLREIMIADDDNYQQVDLFDKLYTVSAVQVGIYHHYLQSHSVPDYLVGCSLGDSAKLVCSGAIAFEQLIQGHIIFGSIGKKISNGGAIAVRSKLPLSVADYAEIENHGLTVAVYQTPVHFLVTGPREALDHWCANCAKTAGYKVKPLYHYPLHSPAMGAAFSAILEEFVDVPPRPWSIGLISATSRSGASLLTDEDQLRRDAIANATGSVYWWQTYQWMVESLGVEKFVNIGPIPTLLLLNERIPVSKKVLSEDALLSPEQLESHKVAALAVRRSVREIGIG